MLLWRHRSNGFVAQPIMKSGHASVWFPLGRHDGHGGVLWSLQCLCPPVGLCSRWSAHHWLRQLTLPEACRPNNWVPLAERCVLGRRALTSIHIPETVWLSSPCLCGWRSEGLQSGSSVCSDTLPLIWGSPAYVHVSSSLAPRSWYKILLSTGYVYSRSLSKSLSTQIQHRYNSSKGHSNQRS